MEEEILDLGIKNLKILRNNKLYKFSMDSVLLADFTKPKKNGVCVDLCCGDGIVLLLLYGRDRYKYYYGVELMSDACEIAEKNIKYNKISDKIKIICNNIKYIDKTIDDKYADIVTCNPPYYKVSSGYMPDDLHQKIARTELMCNMEDVCFCASRLLNNKGTFYMIHKSERLEEIFNLLQKYNLTPKRIRFVHSKIDKEAKLVLIESIKNAKSGVTIEPPLIIYNDSNEYTDEVYKIYNMEEK